MILTPDLCPSNLVNLKGKIIPVSYLNTLKDIEDAKPIPLDFRLLTWNCGFKFNDIEIYKTDEKGNIFCLDRSGDEFYFNTGTFKRKLEYLHEVQNIYLDLFKKELDVQF